MSGPAAPVARPEGLTVVVMKGYPRLSETFIAQELLGLERLGHRLAIVALRRPGDGKTHPVHRQIAAPVHYLPEYLHQAPLRVLAALAKMAMRPPFWRTLAGWCADFTRDPSRNRIRRLGQAAVLVAELPAGTTRLYAHFIHTPSAVTRYASAMTGLPWSLSAHAKDIWTSPSWELRRNLESVQFAATCTRAGLERLEAHAPAPGVVHLIYHGLDLERFTLHPAQGSLRDGAMADQPIRLLTVGRAVEKKGFDVLLDALARLPTSLAWRLEHIGGGERLAALKAQAQRLGIADRIAWRGSQEQPEVLASYRGADLFVLPCRVTASGDRDGLPNVLVEAQSQGLACLSTRVGGVPELIEHGETGWLVSPDDPVELASAMVTLAAEPRLRQRLASAGERRVRSAFSADAGIASISHLLQTTGDQSDERNAVPVQPSPATGAGVGA